MSMWDAEGPDDWRFDERDPHDVDETYTPEGVGRWGNPANPLTPFTKNDEKEKREMTTQNAGPSTNKSKDSETLFITPVFRVSYPNVFKPRAAAAGAEPKYSVAMIFPKTITDPAEKAKFDALRAAVSAAGEKKWGADRSKWPTKKIPDGNGGFVTVGAIQSPWHDGAEKDGPGYGAEVVFANASSKYQPGLVDQKLQPIITPTEFYPGCYARAQVSIFAYDNKTLGISLGLRHLQKIKDGEPIGGGGKAEDAFDAIESPAGVGAAGVGAAPAAAGALGV